MEILISFNKIQKNLFVLSHLSHELGRAYLLLPRNLRQEIYFLFSVSCVHCALCSLQWALCSVQGALLIM